MYFYLATISLFGILSKTTEGIYFCRLTILFYT